MPNLPTFPAVALRAPTWVPPPHLRPGTIRNYVVAIGKVTTQAAFLLDAAGSMLAAGDSLSVVHIKDWVAADACSAAGVSEGHSHSVTEVTVETNARAVAHLCYSRGLNVLFAERLSDRYVCARVCACV